jgi:5-methylcytosine-specific restriction enzyme A
MPSPSSLKPTSHHRVIDLLIKAGADVSGWANYRGKDASTNPKYCYNWSFEQAGEFITLCLWFKSLTENDGQISFALGRQGFTSKNKAAGSAIWRRRSSQFRRNVEVAFREQLPVRVIVLDGRQRQYEDEKPKASSVEARLLDPVSWAVVEYNFMTGECLIVRGAKPTAASLLSTSDAELSFFEGREREAFVRHRRREARLRREKIKAFKIERGRLYCEVPFCGFDFEKSYGELGRDYAQVHHRLPLKKAPKEGRETKLSELAVVCANCHAMIHRGGEC